MGLLKKFFNQARKPEGFLGSLMIKGMNSGHAVVADWGISHLNIAEPSRILDIGCGGGRNAFELLKKYSSSQLTAFDYSPFSVAKTKEYNKDMIASGRCKVFEGSIPDTKLDSEKFDLATAFETIYFWQDLNKCFAEVSRILKPGGHFLIVNESDGKDKMTLRFEKIIDGMKTYTPDMIKESLNYAGFSEIRTEHHESKPWIMILAKK